MQFPMPIFTPRLLIRPPQAGDTSALNAAILESFEVLHEFMDWAKEKPSLEDSQLVIDQARANWILKKNEEPYLPLWIYEIDSNEFVGATGFHHYNWDIPSLEIGYWIRKSYAGQGFMSEAVNALTQYAFRQLKVCRVAITCDLDNVASKKIPERLNFTLEGTLRFHRRKPINNDLSHTLVYAKHDLAHLPSLEVKWGNNRR